MSPRFNRQRSVRKGAASVEFAITLPIILLVVFATIEICSCYSLQQSLKVAAYQGCRVGLSAESTQNIIERQTRFVLDARGIKRYGISTRQDPMPGASTKFLTVQVNAPTGENLPLTHWVIGNRNVSASVSMMIER